MVPGVLLAATVGALSLFAGGSLAELPTSDDKSSGNRSSAAKEDGAEEDALLTVAEARSQARLLHETYESTLRAMHRRYFRDDGKLPVPSRVLDEVFSDLANRSDVKTRWLAVNAQAMSVEHEPKDDFEKQAAIAIRGGDRPAPLKSTRKAHTSRAT